MLVVFSFKDFNIIAEEKDGYIVQLGFTEQEETQEKLSPIMEKLKKELEEYFSGTRKEFEIPIKFGGTDFQMKVWEALRTIKYGETKSYKDIAEKIGSPKSCRAVGTANGKNPIGIIVPCHRVINESGKLGGYNGGIDKKIYLLDLEKNK